MRASTFTFGLVLILGSVVPQPAMAQSVSGLTNKELNLPTPSTHLASSFKIRVEENSSFQESCPFSSSDLTTNIKNINFTSSNYGNVPPEILKTLTKIVIPIGDQPLSVICDLRDYANAELRKDGWLATVQIPQQELIDTLQLKVISGKISEFKIQGQAGPYYKRLMRQLETLKLLDPLNERDVERILLNIKDIPGLDLRLRLAAVDGQTGNLAGYLSVNYVPYAVTVNARNYNASRIGRETIYSRYEHYGLTGLADVTYVGAKTTLDFNGQIIAQAGHEFGVGKNNFRLGANITYAKSRPDIENLPIESDAFLINWKASYSALRTPSKSANVELGFDYINQSTFVGATPLSQDAIRALYIRGHISGVNNSEARLPRINYTAFLELRKGIRALGSTQTDELGIARTDGISASRPFGSATNFITRGGLDLVTPIGDLLRARLRSEAQWTQKPLLSYDEYAVGNLSIGRGYDPGAVSGDKAFSSSFELSRNVPGKKSGNLQLFSFYDLAHIENLDFGTIKPKRTLNSVGAGARFYFANGFKAELTYAKPLDTPFSSGPEKPPDRLLFSITT